MIFKTEAEFLKYAEETGRNLRPPAVFELIGDVGAGKTTFTRGLARGLGVQESVTSPSFSISKRYEFRKVLSAYGNPEKTGVEEALEKASEKVVRGELVHYDFYRLEEPGIMALELAETLEAPDVVIVVEWGESVKDLLPEGRRTLRITVLPDGARKVEEKPISEGRVSEPTSGFTSAKKSAEEGR